MQYLLMIIEDEANYAAPGTMEAIIAKHMAFGEKHGAAIRGGNGLEPSATATTIRTVGGTQSIHDGPFAETREQFGGYYVVEAQDLDTALAIARDIPLTGDGVVEVRPVLAQQA